jgi:hypothetical protein
MMTTIKLGQGHIEQSEVNDLHIAYYIRRQQP